MPVPDVAAFLSFQIRVAKSRGVAYVLTHGIWPADYDDDLAFILTQDGRRRLDLLFRGVFVY